MRRHEALAILAAHQEQLKGFGVKSLALFGSVARDEASADSDVDLLVEFSQPVDLFEFVRLQQYSAMILMNRCLMASGWAKHETFARYHRSADRVGRDNRDAQES